MKLSSKCRLDLAEYFTNSAQMRAQAEIDVSVAQAAALGGSEGSRGRPCRASKMAITRPCGRVVGLRAAVSGNRGEVTRQDAAGCVLYASEKAMEVATQGVQAMGGAGYMNDSPLSRIMRELMKVTG